MYKVCIFDLDGTIADTVESMAYVGNQVLREFGLTALPVENYNFYAGDGADELVRRMLAATPGGDKADYEQIRTVYRQRFAENPFYHVKPFDGIIELLEKLKEENIKIAVLSNKPHEAAVKVIEKMFGNSEFDMVLGQSEAIRKKPAPDGPLKAASEFGVSPSECMYVGDTKTDMETGTAAKMHTVGVLWGFRDREELESNGAEKVAEKPQDLLYICEEWKND